MRRELARRAVGCTLVVLMLAPAALGDSRGGQPFAQKASWQMPQVEKLRAEVFDWYTAAGVDDVLRAQAEALWESAALVGNQAQVLDVVCASFALVDPQARQLVAICSQPHDGRPLPDVSWLADDKRPAVARDNLRLLFGRWLAQETLYDEALAQLDGMEPAEVADPAGLLFYQAVVYQRMLKRDPGLSAISRLLENEATIPRRYASLARLLQADLEGLKDDSLDHIARRMDDIRRRLDLGRSGEKVRQVEDDVIASLDKLIEEMEQQQQAAAAAAAGQQGGQQQQMPQQPLQDSLPMQGKGEGKVDKKPIGEGSGWGDLPPRERQEALQQIGKEFPAHYRDMIEQYFRNLATESENADK